MEDEKTKLQEQYANGELDNLKSPDDNLQINQRTVDEYGNC